MGTDNNRSLIQGDLSGEVIGAAMAVLNALKPGLDEKLYENALVLELLDRDRKIEQQKRFPVYYKGNLIGTLIPDLIVDGIIIVDTKVVTSFIDTHLAQMIGYLNITGLELGLLLNFKQARLEWKRVLSA
jgi:GxxExxY protein